MPCLTSCCCGFSVKAGTRAIAILSVVSVAQCLLIMMIDDNDNNNDDNDDDDDDDDECGDCLSVSSLELCCQVYSVLGLLMVGTFNLEKDRLLDRQVGGWPGPSNGNPSFHGVVWS